jgi:hypothetical protein
MFGVRFLGHSDLRRILLPDDWEGFPLRKDYKPRRPTGHACLGGLMEVDYSGDVMTLNMGPQHPSTHGVLRLELKTDGEIVADAIPHIGYLHRCFEKHVENVEYASVVPYVDRMDYCAAMNMELGYVLAVEKLLGIQVNNRVRCIRIIMASLPHCKPPDCRRNIRQ